MPIASNVLGTKKYDQYTRQTVHDKGNKTSNYTPLNNERSSTTETEFAMLSDLLQELHLLKLWARVALLHLPRMMRHHVERRFHPLLVGDLPRKRDPNSEDAFRRMSVEIET